jgi:hypothetical protein
VGRAAALLSRVEQVLVRTKPLSFVMVASVLPGEACFAL